MKNDFDSLAFALHPKKFIGRRWKEKEEELVETKERILDYFWKKIEDVETTDWWMDDALDSLVDYLEQKELLPTVIERMSAELEGRLSGKKYVKLFASSVLRHLPLEDRKELFWSNLKGPQLVLYTTAFPDELKGELLARLQREFPEKYEAYCLKDSYAKSDRKRFLQSQEQSGKQ